MLTSRELARALRDALLEDPVGVPVRALIAAALMCTRGDAPTRLGMAKVAGYSYGSSQTHYRDLLNALVERVPILIADMASDAGDPAAATRLRADLQHRDATIANLRSEYAALTERHEHLRRYALAMHGRLRDLEGDESVGEARLLPFAPQS